MTSIYEDGAYLKNAVTWHVNDSPWKAKEIIKILKKNSLSINNICEVGCGAGEILNYLSENYNKNIFYFGYEISPQAYEICRHKEKKKLKFYLADLLGEKNVNFDLILAIDVIEHIEDYIGFLNKLKNIGKYKVFHFPIDLSAQTILRSSPILNCRNVSGHLHYFTKETALETLKYTGYRIIDYNFTAASNELPNRGWKANLLKIPRKLMFKVNQDFVSRLLGGYSLMVLAK